MEKQQTAMHELINRLKNFVKELYEKYDGDPLVKRGVFIAIGEANKLLPSERQQIEDAYLEWFKIRGEGYNAEYPFEVDSDEKIFAKINPNYYYTQKYGQ